MDIAFVNRMLGMIRGGGEIWDLRIAEQLEELGVNITFYVGKPLTSELSDPVEEFDTVEVPTPHLRELAYAAPIGIGGVLYDLDSSFFRRRVVKELQDTDHDIIQVNSDPQFGRFVDQFDRPIIVKMNGPPHSLWQDYIHPFSSSYDFFEKFDAVIATGVTTEKIQKRTGIDVHTINPGVNTEQFTPDNSETEGKIILFVGRFVPAKNLTALIRAFKQVRTNHPDVELVLVGDGPRRGRVESKINTLGLNDTVTFRGYVANEDLPKYYRQSDIFVLSSRHENHPITLLEAMSCGTAVIGPNIGWIPRIIDNEQNGLLFNSEDKLVSHLNRLLSDPDLRRQYGEYGRQKAVNGFDWGQRAISLKTIYNDILLTD